MSLSIITPLFIRQPSKANYDRGNFSCSPTEYNELAKMPHYQRRVTILNPHSGQEEIYRIPDYALENHTRKYDYLVVSFRNPTDD